MVNAVRQYNRVFQTGSMQRSSREFRFACELVRNGYIGDIKHVTVGVGGPPEDKPLPPEPCRIISIGICGSGPPCGGPTTTIWPRTSASTASRTGVIIAIMAAAA